MERKYTHRSSEDKKVIVHRLNRIEGQVNGVKKMVEEDRYCDDILIQLQAIDKSIKSLANVIIESHIYKCVPEEFENGNMDIIHELVGLYRRMQ